MDLEHQASPPAGLGLRPALVVQLVLKPPREVLPDRFRPDFLNTFVPSEGGFLVHTDTLERWPHVATVDTTQGPQQTRAKAFNFASTVKEKTKSRTQSQVVLWMEGRSLTMQKRNTNQAEMYFVDSELEMVAAMLAFEEAQRI
jgi:hypothetical protein